MFGWLYQKHGIESAMIVHFSADIVLHVLMALQTEHLFYRELTKKTSSLWLDVFIIYPAQNFSLLIIPNASA